MYRYRWPFHPGHLADALGEAWKGVLGSKGFFWIASRPDVQAMWSQAGLSVSLEPMASWCAAMPEDGWGFETDDDRDELLARWDPLLGDREIELVFIGIEMDEADIRARLDACVLTAAEFEKGIDAWAAFDDPLPEWDLSCDLDS